ncbi:DNA-binding protein [Rhodobacter xanthinilyticus]|uniref:DNA-binding protein n=1 Tax=Rhodobacter xanthinilyticus TaxID=1850250 RepID=A0A1D9MAX3_9RHOB|nr:HTH domain-containing protein [Rhodobacter xanthinilyticus]AOZ69016.1 DNA-binding protein [Rhodobacter xanthinilyticus]
MPRNDRLQSLIVILRDGEMHRARDLAARLGVSERTIWRDMAELQAFGVPVQGSRGVGYMLRRALALPPLVLTPEEVAALGHLLRLAEAHVDTRIGAGARSLAAKIRAALPPEAEEDENPVEIAPSPPLAPPDAAR